MLAVVGIVKGAAAAGLHLGNVRQRVIGAAARLRIQEPAQHRQIELHGLGGPGGQLPPGRIREEPVGQLQIAFLQPALRRGGAKQLHHRQAGLQHRGAGDSAASQLPGQPGEKVSLLEQALEGGLAEPDPLQNAG